MESPHVFKRLVALGLVLAMLIGAFVVVVRPLSVPKDATIITIDAPIERVRPLVAQVTPLGGPASRAVALEPVDALHTRVIVQPSSNAANPSLFEPFQNAMTRRAMTGVKALAERGDHRHITNVVTIASWIATAALLVIAIVLVLRGVDWWRPLLGIIAAAIGLQFLTLVQPPLLLAIATVVLVAELVWWPAPVRGR